MSEGLRVETSPTGYRTYWYGETELESVTTSISNGTPKAALKGWAAKMCAEFVANNLEAINALVGPRGGKAGVIDLVKKAPDRDRNVSAAIGTALHDTAEALLTNAKVAERHIDKDGNDLTDQVAPFVATLRQFFADYKPWPVEVEPAVFSLKHGYAGRADLFCTFGEAPALGRVLCDWKTTKPGRAGHGIYPETALQLNAYANAEFLLTRAGVGRPLPRVDGLYGVNIRPEGYTVVPIEKSARAFETFLNVKAVARFTRHGGDLLGAPLPHPQQHDADEMDRMSLLTRIGRLSPEGQTAARGGWKWGSLKEGSSDPLLRADVDAADDFIDALLLAEGKK